MIIFGVKMYYQFLGCKMYYQFLGCKIYYQFLGCKIYYQFWGAKCIINFWGATCIINFWGAKCIINFWGAKYIINSLEHIDAKPLLGKIQAGCSTPLISTHYAIQCKNYIVTFFVSYPERFYFTHRLNYR
jgi:hypothetical protein